MNETRTAARRGYCHNCGGEGWLPSQPTPATCPACNGTGGEQSKLTPRKAATR